MQHRPNSDGKETVARALGQTFATVQHLTDLAIAWGSRKLKQVGSGAESTASKGVVPILKRFGKSSARFVGTMGDSYYEWYEKLKARKRS
ncbi:MAG: hypothetical protein PHX93_03050 [Candidatus Peribacteraceae bacterium]|jgi:hypothetical protein|nr:hypothetical protein [Candidatus Peribacteraceae bacterium]